MTSGKSMSNAIEWRAGYRKYYLFLSAEFHEQKSLPGFITWGLKDSYMTKVLSIFFFFLMKENKTQRELGREQ